MEEKSEVMEKENSSLNSGVFYEVLDRSKEINKLCEVIFKELYNKRVRLLGEMVTDNSIPEEVKKNGNPSWIDSIELTQVKIIKKLIEIKEVVESI